MTNDELKKKIVEILCKVWLEPVPCTAERKFERIADALIAAGIGDTSDLEVKCEVLQRDVDNLTRTMEEGAEELEEAEHRAEVAKRALEHEIKNRINITGDVESLVYTYYGRAIYQAEKELAEEGKGAGETESD